MPPLVTWAVASVGQLMKRFQAGPPPIAGCTPAAVHPEVVVHCRSLGTSLASAAPDATWLIPEPEPPEYLRTAYTPPATLRPMAAFGLQTISKLLVSTPNLSWLSVV